MEIIRKITSVSLVTIFCFGIIYQTGTIVNFYMFQKESALINCVNKDKPQLHCQGQCQLNKKLVGQEKSNAATNSMQAHQLVFWLFGVEEINQIGICGIDFLTNSKYNFCSSFNEISIDRIELPPKIQSLI